jgi:hypothetical protein
MANHMTEAGTSSLYFQNTDKKTPAHWAGVAGSKEGGGQWLVITNSSHPADSSAQ